MHYDIELAIAQIREMEDLFHNELIAFVRKLALRNDNGHYVDEHTDVSLYDKLADICQEAENILIDNGIEVDAYDQQLAKELK